MFVLITGSESGNPDCLVARLNGFARPGQARPVKEVDYTKPWLNSTETRL